VANHEKNWIHFAQICRINKSKKTAVVKWDITLKKDMVNLGDYKKYDELDVNQMKLKSTNFFLT
jgi:hypothetical protein